MTNTDTTAPALAQALAEFDRHLDQQHDSARQQLHSALLILATDATRLAEMLAEEPDRQLPTTANGELMLSTDRVTAAQRHYDATLASLVTARKAIRIHANLAVKDGTVS